MQFNPNMYMNYEDTGDAAPMVRAAPVKTGPSDALIQQILGSNSDKWTGQGYGSAQANAADMAKILSGIGITDISQFGQLPDGSYGNKVTGQAVPNTYSERQTGNAWGGTFQGKGNTGYRVSFDAQGNPQFYTTGASSSDVPSWVAPALAIGGLAFGIPGLSELITSAGGAIGDALTGAFGADAAAAPLATGGADLYADLAGAASGNSVAPLAAGGADLYGDLAAGTPLTDIGAAAPTTAPGTALSDVASMGPQTEIGSQSAVQQLQNDLSQYQAAQQPVLPTDVAAASTPDAVAAGQNPAQGIKPSANPNLSVMDGGQGIIAPTSAGIDSMGGATGILAPAAGGGVLSAGGVNTGANIAGNIGAGVNAINTGVATNPAITSGSPVTTPTDSLTAGMTPAQIAALASGALGAVGGVISNNAIDAAQAGQTAAMEKSAGTLTDIYGQNKAALAPYQQTGVNATNQINDQMPYFTHQFDANDLNSQLAPNYQFMLGQGQMANQRAANVGGGALSGNTLTGLNRYTQDYAGNAYQNAFNNYNTQRNNIYNTLKGISDIGTNANNQFINAGNSYGTNMTNLNVGNAAANAAAIVGKAQNTGTTISNLGSAAIAAILGQNNAVTPVKP